jgi:hypothetical protein
LAVSAAGNNFKELEDKNLMVQNYFRTRMNFSTGRVEKFSVEGGKN